MIAINDNRAVYRSRLLLDDDLAARGAALGRIYTDIGFQQLAVVEAAKSLSLNPRTIRLTACSRTATWD